MRRLPWAFLFAACFSAAAAACGSFSGSSSGDAADAATNDDVADTGAPVDSSPNDAGTDAVVDAAPRCHPGAPFGAPSPLPGVNSADDEEDAFLTDDELTVYFSVTASGVGRMYTATRPKPTDAFGARTPLLSTVGDHQARPVLSADAKTVVFSSVSPAGGLGSYDLVEATRADALATFSNPTVLLGVSSSALDGDPWLTRSGALWLSSNRLADGALAFDLFRAAPLADGGFDVPSRVEVGGTHTEAKPVTNADESLLFFSSQKVGSDDIWVTTRTPGGAYGTPVKVEELDTAAYERPSWLSADGCVLVFTSDRDGGAGGKDLYVAQRAP